MPDQSPKRGARPSPRSALAGATPFSPPVGAPLTFLTRPQQISMWGNDVHGDCVTAEEAFAKACNSPEIFISDDQVISRLVTSCAIHSLSLHELLRSRP